MRERACRRSEKWIVRVVVSALALAGVWLGAVSVAAACSAGPGIRSILPADGATVPPESSFTVVVLGSHEVELTRVSDETTVQMASSKMADALITREVFVYEPQSVLQPGDYRLTVRAELTAGSKQEETRTYTVAEDAASPGLPDSLGAPSLSAVEFLGGASGGTCGREGGSVKARVEIPGLGSGQKTPALVQLQYRENPSPMNPGETDAEIFMGEGITARLNDGDFERDQLMNFVPACVRLRAYAADRVGVLEAEICGLDRCDRRSGAPNEVDWTMVSMCDGGLPPAGGGDAGDAGLDAGPGGGDTGVGDVGDGGSDEDTGVKADVGGGKEAGGTSDAGVVADGGDVGSATEDKEDDGGGCAVVGGKSRGPAGMWLVLVVGVICGVRRGES